MISFNITCIWNCKSRPYFLMFKSLITACLLFTIIFGTFSIIWVLCIGISVAMRSGWMLRSHCCRERKLSFSMKICLHFLLSFLLWKFTIIINNYLQLLIFILILHLIVVHIRVFMILNKCINFRIIHDHCFQFTT